MIQLIRRLIFAWKYKCAVRTATRLAELTGMRYLVIYLNGSLKVVPKQTIRELVRRHRFRKGVTVDDIERRALFITK